MATTVPLYFVVGHPSSGAGLAARWLWLVPPKQTKQADACESVGLVQVPLSDH